MVIKFHEIGEYLVDWRMDSFTFFDGKVTLSN